MESNSSYISFLSGRSVNVFRIDIPGWTKAVDTYEPVWHGLDWSGRWPFPCEFLQVSGQYYPWFLLSNISFCLALVPQRCFWQALWCSVNVTELRRFQYVPLESRPDTWWWLKTWRSPFPCQGQWLPGRGCWLCDKVPACAISLYHVQHCSHWFFFGCNLWLFAGNVKWL